MRNKKTPFKFNKNSVVNYVRNMREDLNESAFTLIELIVVMAILAILVLLAAPQFLGYTDKAKVANIQNDVAVAEMKTSENLIDHQWAEKEFDSWPTAGDETYLKEIAGDETGGGLYGKGGKIDPSKDDIPEGGYRIIPGTFLEKDVRTQLDGTFFANKDGVVFYTTNTSSEGNNDGGNLSDDIQAPNLDDYVLADEVHDFEEMLDPWGMNMIWRYVGTDDYVIIPDSFDDYSYMFTDTKVKGVLSTRTDLDSVGTMFYGYEGDTLYMNGLADTLNNASGFSQLFRWTDIDVLDLTGVDLVRISNLDEYNIKYDIFMEASIGTIIVDTYDDAATLDSVIRQNEVGFGGMHYTKVIYDGDKEYNPLQNESNIVLDSTESRFERGSKVPFVFNHDELHGDIRFSFWFVDQHGNNIGVDSEVMTLTGETQSNINLQIDDIGDIQYGSLTDFDVDSEYTLREVYIQEVFYYGDDVIGYYAPQNSPITFDMYGTPDVDFTSPILESVDVIPGETVAFRLIIEEESDIDYIDIQGILEGDNSIEPVRAMYDWNVGDSSVKSLGNNRYEIIVSGEATYYKDGSPTKSPTGVYNMNNIRIIDSAGLSSDFSPNLTFEIK